MTTVIHRCDQNDNEAHIFIIREDEAHRWSVTTPDSKTGGIFAQADEACRFARGEARTREHAEVVIVGDACVDIEVFDHDRLTEIVHVNVSNRAPETDR
jgi:hypothetical protein